MGRADELKVSLLLLDLLLLGDEFPVGGGAVEVVGDVEVVHAFGGEFGGDGLEFFGVDLDVDGFAGGAAVEAAVGGDVAEVSSYGDFYEVGAGEGAVGGVEADPAGAGEIEFGPGVGLGVAAEFVGIRM